MIYQILFEKELPQELLQKEVAKFYNLDMSQVGYINLTIRAFTPVNIEVDSFEGSFRTRLNVYVDKNLKQVLEIDMSLYLANKLQSDVLISHWSSDPSLWLLIEPSMLIYEVIEAPTEKDFFLEINKSYKKELSLETVRANMTS